MYIKLLISFAICKNTVYFIICNLTDKLKSTILVCNVNFEKLENDYPFILDIDASKLS